MRQMTVYIASWFASKDRIAQCTEELAKLGITCTSRWAYEQVPHTAQLKDLPDEYHRETALADLEDIQRSDVMVLMTPTEEDLKNPEIPIASWSRGGRHFETGLFYATAIVERQIFGKRESRRKLILCGKRENVFHSLDGEGCLNDYVLPVIVQLDNWEQTKQYLVALKPTYEAVEIQPV